MLSSTYMSFPRATLANKNVSISQNQRQGSKPRTSQNPIFVNFFSSFSVRLALQLLQWWWSIMHQTEGITHDWCLSTLIVAKRNVLCSISGHSKVQAPNLILFCYCIITIYYCVIVIVIILLSSFNWITCNTTHNSQTRARTWTAHTLTYYRNHHEAGSAEPGLVRQERLCTSTSESYNQGCFNNRHNNTIVPWTIVTLWQL